jgi:hypothetical protein
MYLLWSELYNRCDKQRLKDSRIFWSLFFRCIFAEENSARAMAKNYLIVCSCWCTVSVLSRIVLVSIFYPSHQFLAAFANRARPFPLGRLTRSMGCREDSLGVKKQNGACTYVKVDVFLWRSPVQTWRTKHSSLLTLNNGHINPCNW